MADSEAQERERKNEERRKAREEQLKQLQEQEKKDEEERQRKREERRKAREEEDRKLKEEIERLENERKNRQASSSQLSNDNPGSSSSSNIISNSTSSSFSSSNVSDDDPELKKIREEREKRMEEKRRQREEAQKAIEEEERKIAERRKERQANRDATTTTPPSVSSPPIVENNDQLEKDRLAKEKADKEEADRKEKERLAKEEADKKEKERLAKEQADKEEADRKEKERLAKEQADKEEADRKEKEKLAKEQADKEEADRIEKERLAKEEADKKEKERLAKEQADKEEADRKEKERLAKEKADKEEADKKEKERLAKEEADKKEKERLAKEEADKKEKERIAKEEADRIEKERLAKEEADKKEKERLAKEQADKEEADRKEKERLAKEEADKKEKERIAKEEADKKEKERLAKEQADKEEADRKEKERIAKEEADKKEKERLAKEKADKEEADRKEKERLAKEKADKEEADRKEKERLAKEKADKEEAEKKEKERLAKEEAEKKEKERLAKEEADKKEKERIAKEEADKKEKERLAKEKADKEEADRKEKERLAKEDADKKEKERLAKEKADKEEADKKEKERLAKEKEDKEAADKKEKERLAKEEADKKEKERLAKEAEEKKEKERLIAKEKSASTTSISKSSAISDAFKQTIEKQLKQQMESKLDVNNKAEDDQSSSSPSLSKLSSLTLDRAKIGKGRKLPTKHLKPTIAIDPSTAGSSKSFNVGGSTSLLAQAEESHKQQQQPLSSEELKDRVLKKMVLPPGAGGLLGGMAALAAEAQKKKLENDKAKSMLMVGPSSKLVAHLKAEEDAAAPSFVKGRSQSVSVTSTMKSDPSKFLNHKKTIDTYSGLRTRLIHCKGKKRILTREVEVSIKSLNKSDAFVLDCGVEGSGIGGESVDTSQHSNIYVWYGSKATASKKTKAASIAEIIKSHERGGHATIIKLDEQDKDQHFYKVLGVADQSKAVIAEDGGDDSEAESHWASNYTLLKYSAEGELVNVLDPNAARANLSLEMLASDSFFVLDTTTEYYAWSGRNCDNSKKDAFLEKARERLSSEKTKKLRHSWVDIIITSEGGEPVMFREKFSDWPDLSHEVSLSRMGFGKKKLFDVAIPYEKKSPAKMNQFDVMEMVHSEPPEEGLNDLQNISESSFEAWVVDGNKLVAIPSEELGHLYSANCYLIRYQYSRWNAFKYIIFIWQGIDANRQDIGISTLLSKDMYIETSAKGDCVQECIRMGREPKQFTRAFNGKVVIHRGVRGDVDVNASRLYHIYGKQDDMIIAIECHRATSAALNSRDIFVVKDGKSSYLWQSRGASKKLIEQSQNLIKLISPPPVSITTIQEGKETDAFWKLLGGQQKYANFDYLTKPQKLQLFAINNTGTIIRADEIFLFNQYEFAINRVFVLDNKVKIYVWSGSKAPEKEKKRAMEIAIDYLHALKDGRKEEDVLFIKEREEPIAFTCCFHAWDTSKYQSSSNGADSEPSPNVKSPVVESASTLLKKYYQILPLEELLKKNTPPEIDRSVLEMYLSDEEFQKVLGCTKSEWEKQPAWKKTEKKKSTGLF